jgi:AcrR family transcriptional regulator
MAIETDTKIRILDTAEKLFATQGFAATSIRQIVKAAGVNIAAIHYHFGSKESLIEAVLARKAAPVNKERLRLLDELEKKHAGKTLPVEGVIEAFIAPVIRMQHGKNDRLFPQLMGRTLNEADEKMYQMVHRIFGEVITRFVRAFRLAVPDIPQDELISRIHFMIGVMAFATFVPKNKVFENLQSSGPGSPEVFIERLVRFTAAGMKATLDE